MIRLTVTLLAALWVAFVIWGSPNETPTQTVVKATPTNTAKVPVATYATPTIIGSDKAAAVEAPEATRAALAPLLPLSTRPDAVSAEEPPLETVAAATLEELPLYTVTGTRVNLRAGPSTDNPVVTALSLGTVTEAIGPEINGWIEIRDLSSGLEGFMATRFLEAL